MNQREPEPLAKSLINGTRKAPQLARTHEHVVPSTMMSPIVYTETQSANVSLGDGSFHDLTDATTGAIILPAGLMFVWVTVDFTGGNAGDEASVFLNIDGSDEASVINMHVTSAAEGGNYAGFWTKIIAAGSHTIKLRAKRLSGAGTFSVKKDNTKFTLMMFEASNVTLS